MAISITVDDRVVLEALGRLIQRLDDLTPAMQDISEVMLDSVQEAFQRQADPETGEFWESLATTTVTQRSKAGSWPGPILRVSGDLYVSITPDAGADFAQVGSFLPVGSGYAAIHQFGGQAGRNRSVHIPARPFMGLSDDSTDEILEIVERYLTPE